MFAAVEDSGRYAVFHLLHLDLAFFVLLDGVVVDTLALCTHLLAKRNFQSRLTTTSEVTTNNWGVMII